MFVGDDDLDGVNNLVTPDPFYFALPFITSMDVFMPAAIPPNGMIHLENISREGFSADDQRAELGDEPERHLDRPAGAPPGDRAPDSGPQGRAQVRGRHVEVARQVREGEGRVHPEVPRPRQRKAGGPYDECRAPYGGATATCILDAKKGAEAKARKRIGKACEKACPTCYDVRRQLPGRRRLRGDDGGPRRRRRPARSTASRPAARRRPRPQAKCEDGVAKSLIKFAGAKAKCYDKCVDQAVQGEDSRGQLHTGDPSDADTQECIAKAEEQGGREHRQGVRGAVARSRRATAGATTAPSGSAVIENLVDAQAPLVYCSSATTTTSITIATTTTTTTTTTLPGSPSPAFLAVESID